MKKKKKTKWEKDPRYRLQTENTIVFRVWLVGTRDECLKLRNTFRWFRNAIRAMDYILSGAEAFCSTIEPVDPRALEARRAEKRKAAAAKRIAEGKSTAEEERKKEEKEAAKCISPEEAGFYRKTMKDVAKALEMERNGMKGATGASVPGYQMRPFFFRKNAEAVKCGCYPMPSYIWDSALNLLTSMRDKAMPNRGGVPRSLLVANGELGNINAHEARIPVIRGYRDHVALYGNEKELIDEYDSNVQFVEEGENQYIILRFCKTPDVRLKLLVTGELMFDDGTLRKKMPPESVRNMFHRFAAGIFPSTGAALGLDEKNRLSLMASYRRPRKSGQKKDADGTMEVVFDRLYGHQLPLPRGKKKEDALKEWARTKDMLYVVHMMHTAKTGRKYVKRIAVNSTVERLRVLEKLKSKKEFQRDSQRFFPKRTLAGINESIRGYARLREQTSRTANHEWTKTIIHHANRWAVKKIVVYNMPKDVGLLLDEIYPWKWSTFRDELESKCKYYKFLLEHRELTDMTPLCADIRSVFSEGVPGETEKEEGDGKEAPERRRVVFAGDVGSRAAPVPV